MKIKNNSKKKTNKKSYSNMVWAIVIAVGIGSLFSYFDASIHQWGSVLGIWILMILFELMDFKK